MKTFSDMQGLTTFLFHTLVLRKLLTDVFHQNKGINLGIQVKKKNEENTRNDGEGNVGDNSVIGLERNQEISQGRVGQGSILKGVPSRKIKCHE